MPPIVDFHIHPGQYGQWHPWVIEWMRETAPSLEQYLSAMEDPAAMRAMLAEAGVDVGVLLAEISPIVTGTIDNDWTAQFAREINALPGPGPRVVAFCCVNPFLVADLAGELDRCVKELGCSGVKLYPPYHHYYPNEARMYPLYAKAQELGVPVMAHTGSSIFKGVKHKYADPMFWDDVASDFPNLNIVMAHSGRGVWYDRAYFLAKLHANVYMEIAGLPPQKLLGYFPELERIPDKVIFGSDWPGMPHIKRNIEAIRGLPLDEATKEKILGGNAARLLHLAPSPVSLPQAGDGEGCGGLS
jgi:predicted TIM-barrel fold metal-dependent hydrolase